VSDVKKIQCPHCGKKINFKRSSTGKWIGTIAGGGVGYAVAGGLGIAGAILGAPIAIPGAIVGVAIGTLLGNRAGSMVDNLNVKCPNCKKSMSI